MSKWKDVSSYSRGQYGTIDPNSWEIEVGYLRIVLHRRHGPDPRQWFGTVHGFDLIDSTEIGEPGDTADHAKRLLLYRVKLELSRHLKLIKELT